MFMDVALAGIKKYKKAVGRLSSLTGKQHRPTTITCDSEQRGCFSTDDSNVQFKSEYNDF